MTTNADTGHDEPIRRLVHSMWAGVAGRWAEHADMVDARGADVTERLLAAAQVGPGDRVLELACGPGGAGLAAATLVGLSGEVVLSDVAAEMAAVAAARAVSRGLTNVRSATLDLEQIDQPDESFDVVLCREGIMFAVDPARAAREIRRVMRPAGRMAVSVWGARSANPWLGLVLDAVGAELGQPVPPPGIPGPLSLGEPGQLRAAVLPSFPGVIIEEIEVPMRAPSVEAWWQRTTALAGPLAGIVAGLTDDAKWSLVERLRRAVEPYETPNGVDLPGLVLLASARRG